jgi:hypothetical protein
MKMHVVMTLDALLFLKDGINGRAKKEMGVFPIGL